MALRALLSLLILLPLIRGQVLSTNNQRPTTVAAPNLGGGLVNWNSPQFAASLDYKTAIANLGKTQNSTRLQATGFNFTIPLNATIVGITTAAVRNASAISVVDATVFLFFAGATIGMDWCVANNTDCTLNGWSSAQETHVWGNSSFLWGLTTLTPAQINNDTFGFALQTGHPATGNAVSAVDVMYMDVYYTLPASTTGEAIVTTASAAAGTSGVPATTASSTTGGSTGPATSASSTTGAGAGTTAQPATSASSTTNAPASTTGVPASTTAAQSSTTGTPASTGNPSTTSANTATTGSSTTGAPASSTTSIAGSSTTGASAEATTASGESTTAAATASASTGSEASTTAEAAATTTSPNSPPVATSEPITSGGSAGTPVYAWIIIGVVGGLLVIGLIIALIVIKTRRDKRKEMREMDLQEVRDTLGQKPAETKSLGEIQKGMERPPDADTQWL